MGKSICSFVGSELNFLKLVSVLVRLSGGVSNFSSKPTQPKLLLLRFEILFVSLVMKNLIEPDVSATMQLPSSVYKTEKIQRRA